MACELCARWWALQWEKSDAWERAYSNESELWWEEPPRNHELAQQASECRETDPEAAFRLNLEAAEAGSAWAMDVVAWCYWMGTGVAADFDKAQEYYRRAMGAGSWMATIHYARLLEDHDYHDECESVLEDGVSSDFVPACYWLALLRYQRCKSRKVCLEIKPILERAANAGHPGALLLLGQMMVRGRFGLRHIPTGFKWGLRWVSRGAADT